MSGADWKSYNEAGATAGPRPRLLQTLDSYFLNRVGKGLDLGCGSGRDTRELLSRGWEVDAVDSDLRSLELTTKMQDEAQGRLSILNSKFEELALEHNRYDLVNASFSLPFCHPSHFQRLWKTINLSLKPDGILSADLFGINDSWNSEMRRPMTFLSLDEIKSLLKPMKIEVLTEIEEDKTSFDGQLKHWHLITCISRKI